MNREAFILYVSPDGLSWEPPFVLFSSWEDLYFLSHKYMPDNPDAIIEVFHVQDSSKIPWENIQPWLLKEIDEAQPDIIFDWKKNPLKNIMHFQYNDGLFKLSPRATANNQLWT